MKDEYILPIKCSTLIKITKILVKFIIPLPSLYGMYLFLISDKTIDSGLILGFSLVGFVLSTSMWLVHLLTTLEKIKFPKVKCKCEK